MKGVRFTEEQINAVLRERKAGAKTADLASKHGISEMECAMSFSIKACFLTEIWPRNHRCLDRRIQHCEAALLARLHDARGLCRSSRRNRALRCATVAGHFGEFKPTQFLVRALSQRYRPDRQHPLTYDPFFNRSCLNQCWRNKL